MTDDSSRTEPPSKDTKPAEPESFRLKPSQNQKKRSKLQQAPEPPPPAPEPDPIPVAPPPEPMRKFRLKRSGQMHDDLKSPFPDDNTPLREPEY